MAANWWEAAPLVAPAGAGHGGKAAPKLSPEDATGLKALVSETQAKQLLASRAQEFMAKQGKGDAGIATGPVFGDTPIINHIIPNIARAVTNVVDPDKASKLQVLDSINNSTWTALRPTGSGPIRGYEASGWKTAFPSVQNYGPANQEITERLNKEYDSHRQKLQFVQDFIHSGKGGYGDAEAAWQQQGQQQPAPQGNAALQQRSAQTRQPVQSGQTVDIFGRPVR